MFFLKVAKRLRVLQKMHTSLIVLEVIWLLYYVSINIATYAITDISVIERAVRQDVFNLGTHISIVLAAIFCEHSTAWLFVLYGFELFRDVMNAVNLQHFSPLQSYNNGLWIGALVLAWYQVSTTIIGMCVCFLSKQKVVDFKVSIYKNKVSNFK